MFLIGQILGMLYVGLVKPGESDTVFSAITALTWLGPLIAWFVLRHRHLGQRQIHGYPPAATQTAPLMATQTAPPGRGELTH